MTPVSVRWVDSVDEWPRLAKQWWRLFDAQGVERTPFVSPAWAESWLRVFGGRLRVAVAEHGGQVVGIAPLMRVGLVAPTYVGIGQEIADYGGFLVAEPTEEISVALLAAIERRLLTRPGLVNLGRLPAGQYLEEIAVRRYADHPQFRLSASQRETAPVLDLSMVENRVQVVERLKKRNDVRRRLNRLADGHAVSFNYDSSADRGALADFLALHDLRWKQKQGAAVGHFVSPRGRRFLAEVVEQMRSRGLVRLSFVEVDGRRAVGRFGFELDATYYGSKSAFNPELTKYGPGHMAVGFLLDEMLGRGLTRFDFMRGDGAHKSAWTKDSTSVTYYALHHRGVQGALEHRVASVRSARRYRWPWSIIAPRLHRRTKG